MYIYAHTYAYPHTCVYTRDRKRFGDDPEIQGYGLRSAVRELPVCAQMPREGCARPQPAALLLRARLQGGVGVG